MQDTTLTRRTFVKSAAVAGAALAMGSALSACLDNSGGGGTTPGAAAGERVFYNSVCHGCIQACPCKVYVEDGVVIKIEGHPDAPTSQGSLCLKGLNQIHTCYSPRRIIYPLRRTGARGVANAAWERISWDEAIELAASKISEAIEKYGTYSFYSTTGGGGGYSFPEPASLSTSFGSPSVCEPGCAQCYLPRTAEAGYMGAPGDQSIADCAVLEPFKGLAPLEEAKGITSDTKCIVVWGAQPSVSQTSQSGRGMAELRARGCKSIVVDPNFSPDAVKATIHLPVRPGSDAALILSWYRAILDEKLYNEEFTKYWTNVPFLINPDTKLPWLATEVFGADAQTTPADTPVYVCVDENTGAIAPLPFGDPAVVKQTVNPQVLATADVNGKSSKTAGQIYRDEAEPWTLEKTEEFCWVSADRNRAAIDLYTNPPGGVAGISNGVATDMMENASQVPQGLLGLDMIMGYIDKPGATVTANGGMGMMGPMPGPNDPQPRPTRAFANFGMGGFGVGYTIGMTEEDNAAAAAAVPDPDMQYALNQILLDRLGMNNHRGLYDWSHAHIPTVREAIETGEPYKPRVWYEFSGNKFAMFGSAGAWYNAIMNSGVDFIMCQYPMITSFQIECADLLFPLEEWLEATGAGNGQLNYGFPSPGVIHLGETVPNTVVPRHILDATCAKMNEKLDTIIFSGTGKTMAESNLKFPLGMGLVSFGGVGGNLNESERWASQIAMYGEAAGCGPDATKEEFMEALKNNHDAYIVTSPSEEYWIYDQYTWEATDGLPQGFATESRKLEVYCTFNLKLGRTGWPYCYPRGNTPIDPRVGTFGGDYSPICNVPVQKEAPEVANAGNFIMAYDPEFPLAITSGRLYYFHHGTMRHAPFTRELYPQPFVRINPVTAAQYGIAHGDWVEISSRRTQGADYDPNGTRGTELSYSGVKKQNTKTAEPIHAIAYVAELVAPNVLWMERFWNPECFDSSQANKTGGWQECNINVITNAVDPIFNEVFGSYTNRGFAVNIKKSQKPANVWTQPKEFEPFMPTTPNEYVSDIGVLISNKELLTEPVVFSPAGGGQ
ncbi:MAG: molybdopterin-dependent oxidoreductase [Coriobacteriales bacterium]|nr:molybdopterin-dependent oxidoreductase [Coriobacteriales bacterium]